MPSNALRPSAVHQTHDATADRVRVFDALRGLTVLSMIGFHATYDLAYLYGVSLPWFTTGVFQGIWRISISWVFLALAGWMTLHSRNNFKRGCQYAAVALAVWIVTSIVRVDTPISFGIIFCMAASTLCFALLEHVAPTCASRSRGLYFAAAACALLFLTLYRIPRARYQVSGLAWLGFPSSTFSSGDYYPVIPFGFLYLAAAFAAHAWNSKTGGAHPTWLRRIHCKPLEIIGRHSLLLYVLHQPVVLVLLELTMGA